MPTNAQDGKRSHTVAILWERGPVRGTIDVEHGTLGRLRPAARSAVAAGRRFAIRSAGPARIELQVVNARLEAGAYATRVTVRSRRNPFTFFLRDVCADCPVYVPEYGVAVTDAADARSFRDIAGAVRSKGMASALDRIEAEPEESYEGACRRNRSLVCPTWLGLSRDMRLFRVWPSLEMGYWGRIDPCYHSVRQSAPETQDKPYGLDFCIGPGASCRVRITRRLEDGVLPILRSQQNEDDVTYHVTAFATLETRPLSRAALRGTDWRAAYPNTGGHMLSRDQVAQLKPLLDAEMRGSEEEVVCCVRVEAVNSGCVPRYAWFKALCINEAADRSFDGETGFAGFASGRVYAVHRIQGRAMPQEEMAILLPPGGTAVCEMLVPHQPLPRARAVKLAALDVDEHLGACRRFWRDKLAAGASIRVPEAPVNERIGAGLLHCDLVALGREPGEDVLATIGWYSPIGSESSPIIQFFDSMGWHGLAERALNFFLSRQRDDGFIQTFGGYQLETGPALWSMGEHYRYTRDDRWVRRIKPKLLKACRFLLDWRARNRKASLRGKGYGLQDGKVADPQDFFHSFMLNGLSYVGIQRAAEMLERTDPKESARLSKEAAAFRKDIRAAFRDAMARSPVVPLGSGAWVPSAPPWAEHPGPLALYAEGGKWFTHGAFSARDSLIGALYLVISEVLDPDEREADFLLASHRELCTVENAGLSQPYYVRHDYAHIRRGEVKPFLKTYYNQFTALQDRETYTFWEHYFHASQHKTHEEGWFLMQTRWMLWLETGGDTLQLLRGVPRAWLEDGKTIELRNVATYFGPLSLSADSRLREGRIEAGVECAGRRRPKTVEIRLPHPEGRKATRAVGGVYDPASETVRVRPFGGRARVTLFFGGAGR